MKTAIILGATLGSLILGYLGQLLDNGNWLGGWSILLSSLGSIVGLWVGYKLYKYYF